MQPMSPANDGIAGELVAEFPQASRDLAEGQAFVEQFSQGHIKHRIISPARMRGLWRSEIHRNSPTLVNSRLLQPLQRAFVRVHSIDVLQYSLNQYPTEAAWANFFPARDCGLIHPYSGGKLRLRLSEPLPGLPKGNGKGSIGGLRHEFQTSAVAWPLIDLGQPHCCSFHNARF